MMKRSLRIGAVVALGLSYASSASAQDQVWLKDRRYQEGVGIRAGALEFHPGVAAEGGYDSNYALAAADDPKVESLRIRVTPSLSVSTLSRQRREGEQGGDAPKLTLRANVAATYNEFIALQRGNSDTASKYRNVGALALVDLALFPGRPWSGDVHADFARTLQPSINPDVNYNRLATRMGAGVIWAPGGGMFDWRLGYEFALTYFEDDQFRNLGTYQHQINTKGRWRFLPRTAILYDASTSFLNYADSPAGKLNSNPIRARLGLNGLLTPSLGLLAMAGWTASFYSGGPNTPQFDGFIGQGELRWYVTPVTDLGSGPATVAISSVGLGYLRDYANSYLADYYRRDRLYLNSSLAVSGRFVATAEGGVSFHRYSAVYRTTDRSASLHEGFSETRFDAALFGEYRFADVFGVSAMVRYSSNVTDTVLLLGGGQKALDWSRVEAGLGLRWFM